MDEREAIANTVREDAVLTSYTTLMHFNTVSNSVMLATALWVLLKKTPDSMTTYRWYLVNLSISCYVLDILLTLLFLPIGLLPLPGGCALGIMALLGPLGAVICWAVHNWLLGMTGVAVQLAFTYRLAALHGKVHLIHRPAVIFSFVLVQATYALPCSVIALIIHQGEDVNSLFILQNHTEIVDYYTTHACSLFAFNVSSWKPYLFAAFAEILLIFLAACLVIGALMRGLAKVKTSISKKTYEMHRALIRALLLQVRKCVVSSTD
ncbi:7TM GPCR protein [Aphelenchoides avenae]|nr:7TM GPCR protein [Aphelenchus avenae]